MPETARPEIAQLRTKVENMVAQDWISPAKRPELGQLNFELALPTLEAGAQLLWVLARMNLNLFSAQRAVNATNFLDNYQGTFNAISNFNLNQSDPARQRDALINQLQAQYGQLLDEVAAPIGVWTAMSTDSATLRASILDEVRPDIASSAGQYKAAVAEIESAKHEAEQALSAIKSAAGKSGVATHSTVFKEQADEHKAASRVWVGLTLLALAAMISWGSS